MSRRGTWIGLALVIAVASNPVAGSGQADGPPQRLVSLVPGATEVLFAIGAGERIVGVSSYDHWPPQVEALPKVGALLDPDLEAILALRPDLVVADPSLTSLAERLDAAGIAVHGYATADVQDVFDQMQRLGRVVGLESGGRTAAARLRSELEIVREAHRVAVPPAVMLVFGRRIGSFAEVWVNGGVGFLHELTEIAGGTNLYRDIERASFKAGLETLLARIPDVVIEMRVDGLAPVDRSAIRAEWQLLPGFQSTRVAVITEPWVLNPGPRLAAAAELIAAAAAGSQ